MLRDWSDLHSADEPVTARELAFAALAAFAGTGTLVLAITDLIRWAIG